MEQIPQAVIDGAGTMSTQTLLWIIAGLMTVITILGNVAKSLIDRRTNPLNGTLTRLNETLIKIDMRTGDSDRVLEGHTEKLIVLGTTMAQLAANEAQQTEVLRTIAPAMDKSITGCAERITNHCKERSGAIIKALDSG